MEFGLSHLFYNWDPAAWFLTEECDAEVSGCACIRINRTWAAVPVDGV